VSETVYRFLSIEDVIELHDMQLVQYGGASGIRSRELLESAVMMPQASFGGEFVHKDIYEMAAAYAFHIAENQPLWMAIKELP
jgi:death-on-curing protein